MSRAIDLARQGMTAGAGGPFGAVVVKDGSIVGEGWNRVLHDKDPTAHGEIVAIRNACENLGTFVLERCEIYTTGQPCPMCLGAIHWARIGRIHFGFRIEDAAEVGFDDSEFYKEMALAPGERRIPSVECSRDASLALLRDYAELENKTPY